jgi:hypothetical protein
MTETKTMPRLSYPEERHLSAGEKRERERDRKSQATASTIEALMLQLRSGGLAELDKESCRRRISELSAEQTLQIVARLQKLQPQYPKITPELISLLRDTAP